MINFCFSFPCHILAVDDSSIGLQNINLRHYLLEMLGRTIAEEKRSQTKYKLFFSLFLLVTNNQINSIDLV